MPKKKKHTWFAKLITRLLILLVIAGVIAGYFVLDYYRIIPRKAYDASDFYFEEMLSEIDYNHNGIDDYSDIVAGAKADAKKHPTYVEAYYTNAYPPDDEGTNGDVVWRALQHAGYDLKELMDADIKKNPYQYPDAEDPNINFRLVNNQRRFFERHITRIDAPIEEIGSWNAGDIIFYKNGSVAILSNIRNKDGYPYLIHNDGQPVREEDTFERYAQKGIVGHYRWDMKGE
ncbi:hypothetical protein EDD63_10666 [Breznakia blatticola]|uniref:DUF1287 domain-containing protein n=1 Tax=Breznakia blatticola TaxID=1754012 RepID=A0A4R8A483_9FIRM|nr:DUF1287 domain-containing protein [Breznakia blatticola]TDW25125.1 hypothetical protein EDD63_10666 [Breznakia blatticola]